MSYKSDIFCGELNPSSTFTLKIQALNFHNAISNIKTKCPEMTQNWHMIQISYRQIFQPVLVMSIVRHIEQNLDFPTTIVDIDI